MFHALTLPRLVCRTGSGVRVSASFFLHFRNLFSFIYYEQAVRLGGRHNMPPPRDLDF